LYSSMIQIGQDNRIEPDIRVILAFTLTVIHFVLQMIRTNVQEMHTLDFVSFIIHLAVMVGTIIGTIIIKIRHWKNSQ
jgi:TRAP-type C4-dicarboxylate transport system permease small subunit